MIGYYFLICHNIFKPSFEGERYHFLEENKIAKPDEMIVISITIDEETLVFVNQIISDKKTNRSAWIREAVREKLARMSYFPDEVKKSLGVVVETSE